MKVYRNSLLKMFHNSGGDWNCGWVVDPMCNHEWMILEWYGMILNSILDGRNPAPTISHVSYCFIGFHIQQGVDRRISSISIEGCFGRLDRTRSTKASQHPTSLECRAWGKSAERSPATRRRDPCFLEKKCEFWCVFLFFGFEDQDFYLKHLGILDSKTRMFRFFAWLI